MNAPRAPGIARRTALASALVAACALGAPLGTSAQQTVVIGGGNAGPVTGGAAVPGRGAGVVVNDDVLNSLGPGGPAPAMPYAAPRAPVTGAPMTGGPVVTPGAESGLPSTAYRLPGSGELVVTRPGTLLYPPLEQPRSRLTLTPPAGMATRPAPAPAQAPEPAPAGAPPKSRLVAAPPKPAAPAPAPAPAKAQAAMEPEAKPAVPPAPSAPKVSAAPSQEAKRETMPSVPAAPAKAPPPPPPANLMQDLREAAPAPQPPTPEQQTPEPSATKSAAAPTAVQGAARTTGEAPRAAPGQVRLGFAAGSADLSDAAKEQLNGLAARLNQDSALRVQLLAYAAANGEGASRARRLSLSRALAVRAYLIEQGIRSTRLDVRALGDQAGDGPADRVDIAPQ